MQTLRHSLSSQKYMRGKLTSWKKFQRADFAVSEQGQLWAVCISYPEEKKGEEKKAHFIVFSHTIAAMFL